MSTPVQSTGPWGGGLPPGSPLISPKALEAASFIIFCLLFLSLVCLNARRRFNGRVFVYSVEVSRKSPKSVLYLRLIHYYCGPTEECLVFSVSFPQSEKGYIRRMLNPLSVTLEASRFQRCLEKFQDFYLD